MPELPEVQTTVDGLNRKTKGKTIVDVWTDIAVDTPSLPHHYHSTKSTAFFASFKMLIVGSKVIKAERRAKNIFIHLSNAHTIWIHMKMTGHMMHGLYSFDAATKTWVPDIKEKNDALRDPFNRFLHTVFTLSDGKQLVLSDVRKFAKVTIIETKTIPLLMKEVGPEPLDPSFTKAAFIERLLKRPLRPIKEVLLDQKIVAGIGNIYSDEMLWASSIHPLRLVKSLSKDEYALLYKAMIEVLKKGIDFGGDSTSDYRDIDGKPGKFQQRHRAYRRTGDACDKKGCGGRIIRMPFGGRGAHFCDSHQK